MKRIFVLFAVLAMVSVGLVGTSPALSDSADIGVLCHVEDQHGNRLPGIDVVFYDADTGGFVNYSTTNDEGFAQVVVPPGNYKVRAVDQSGSGYVEEWYVDKDSYETADVLAIDSGAWAINVVMGLGGTITGQVLDEATLLPIEDANPLLFFEDSSWGQNEWRWRTDSFGRYEATGLKPGTYRVSFDEAGYIVTWYNGEWDKAGADTVVVAASTVTPGIDFLLVRGGTITGTVRSARTGLPVENVWMHTLKVATGEYFNSSVTDSTGNYEMDSLVPGEWIVHAQPMNPGCAAQWLWDHETQGEADPIHVDAATTMVVADVHLDCNRFIDIDDSVFKEDIEWLAAEGITLGCNAAGDRFCPLDPVTRAEMAAFLVRALDLTAQLDDPFIDDDGSIFEAYIEKLAAAGITKGCNFAGDKFCPNAHVTRGEMAAFITRAMGYTDNGGGNLFIDDDGSIFENDIDCIATAGVTKGCNPTGDMYCPDRNVTREEMAAFLHRSLG